MTKVTIEHEKTGQTETLDEMQKPTHVRNSEHVLSLNVDDVWDRSDKRKRLSAISDSLELDSPEDVKIDMDIYGLRNGNQRDDDMDVNDPVRVKDMFDDMGDAVCDSISLTVEHNVTLHAKIDTKNQPKIHMNPEGKTNPKLYDQNTGRPLARSVSQIQRMKMIRIPRDSSFRKLVRQISGHGGKSDQSEDKTDSPEEEEERVRPRTFFDLAIVTMCCCVSPLGFVAVIMAVLSDANYKAGHIEKSSTYSKLALILSIIGIIATLTIGITLLMVFRYPWSELEHP